MSDVHSLRYVSCPELAKVLQYLRNYGKCKNVSGYYISNHKKTLTRTPIDFTSTRMKSLWKIAREPRWFICADEECSDLVWRQKLSTCYASHLHEMLDHSVVSWKPKAVPSVSGRIGTRWWKYPVAISQTKFDVGSLNEYCQHLRWLVPVTRSHGLGDHEVGGENYAISSSGKITSKWETVRQKKGPATGLVCIWEVQHSTWRHHWRN